PGSGEHAGEVEDADSFEGHAHFRRIIGAGLTETGLAPLECPSMATKILTSDLRIGMFVADLDRPWVDTPFLLQGFLIEDEEQIHALRKHCEYVIVDRARSTGKEFEAPKSAAPNVASAPGAKRVVTQVKRGNGEAEAVPPPS